MTTKTTYLKLRRSSNPPYHPSHENPLRTETSRYTWDPTHASEKVPMKKETTIDYKTLRRLPLHSTKNSRGKSRGWKMDGQWMFLRWKVTFAQRTFHVEEPAPKAQDHRFLLPAPANLAITNKQNFRRYLRQSRQVDTATLA